MPGPLRDRQVFGTNRDREAAENDLLAHHGRHMLAHDLGDPSRESVSKQVEVDREGAKTPAGHGTPTVVVYDRVRKTGLVFKGFFDCGDEPMAHEDA